MLSIHSYFEIKDKKSGRFPIFGPVQSSMEKLLKENSRYEAELRDHYFVSMPSVY